MPAHPDQTEPHDKAHSNVNSLCHELLPAVIMTASTGFTIHLPTAGMKLMVLIVKKEKSVPMPGSFASSTFQSVVAVMNCLVPADVPHEEALIKHYVS